MLKSVTFFNKLKKLETHYQINLKWLLYFIEFLIVVFTIPLSYAITRVIFNHFGIAWDFNIYQFGFFSFFLVFFWFVLSQVTSMAMLPRAQRYISAGLIFLRGYFLIYISLMVVKFALGLTAIPSTLIFINVHLAFIFTLGLRILTIHFLRVYRTDGYNLRNIVIIGDACSHEFIDKLNEQKDWGFKIRAIITKSNLLRKKFGDEIPIIAGTENISYILESQIVDEVFYCKKNIDQGEVRKIIKDSNEIGVVFRVQTATSTLAPERVQLKTVNDAGKLTLVDIPSRKLAHDIKTITDVFFSSTAIILLSPFLLLIAMVVKLTSRGPALFAQERVGLRGRKFKLYKFRTMREDAEQMLEKLRAQNEMDGPTFKLKNDPRITPVGKFLRKTGLDELPQLYNVARGEMSLIGPRPPLESEVQQYQRWQLRRLSVKPGISCTWQIMPHRNDIKFEKWMRMDLNYIDNWSLTKDVRLIFKTISALLFATGR